MCCRLCPSLFDILQAFKKDHVLMLIGFFKKRGREGERERGREGERERGREGQMYRGRK